MASLHETHFFDFTRSQRHTTRSTARLSSLTSSSQVRDRTAPDGKITAPSQYSAALQRFPQLETLKFRIRMSDFIQTLFEYHTLILLIKLLTFYELSRKSSEVNGVQEYH